MSALTLLKLFCKDNKKTKTTKFFVIKLLFKFILILKSNNK